MVAADGPAVLPGPGRTAPPAASQPARSPAAGVRTAAQRSRRGGSERGCGGRRRRLSPVRQSWDLRFHAYP